MFSNLDVVGDFPIRLDIVPSKVSARVWAHEARAGRHKAPCWTYISDGLWTLGQKEVIITLSREVEEKPTDFPRAPLKFFSHLHSFADAGASVDAGDVTQFEGAGFLGLDGIVYANPQPLEGVEVPDKALAAVLVTEEELRVSQLFGATRVLAQLGRATGHYPYPVWSDRSRTGLNLDRMTEQSVLARIERKRIPGVRVRVEANRIIASVAPESADELKSALDRAPTKVPLAIPTELDPVADGCLVWEPGRLEPTVVAPSGSRRRRLSGCFIALVPGQKEDVGEIVEDGMVVSLTDRSWLALRGAVETRAPLTIPGSSGRFDFSFTWHREI